MSIVTWYDAPLWGEPLNFDKWADEFSPLVRETNFKLKIESAKRWGDYDAALQHLKTFIHYKIDNGYYGGKNISKIRRSAW